MTVYLNGQFLSLEDAKISVLDRGFIYGDGVYELIPVYAREPYRMPQHLARLQRSLDGIGLANPTIAGAALRVVHPARTGMASGISNTCRLGGLAVGVAILGVLLQHRIGDHLAATGYHGKAVSAAVASSGLRAAAGNPRLGRVADVAFVSGLHLIFLTGCLALLVGAGASLLVRSRRAEATEPAPAAAS